MITFYADSVNEAYSKLQTREFRNEIRCYLLVNRNNIDKNNILDHFELDAYEVCIRSNDLITQSSRLAIAFKTVIINEFEAIFNSLTSNISLESKDISYSEIDLKANTFKKNLKILRNEHSLTQRELAQSLHNDQTAISQWETNKTKPSMDNLIKLAEILECEISDLVGIEKTKERGI